MSSESKIPVSFQLKDGQSLLTSWKQYVNKVPTIGDSIGLDDSAKQHHADYESTAKVVQIDYDAKSSETSVILEASPKQKELSRTVVFLNSNFIPENLRGEAEERVRGAFNLPLIEWVNSYESKPVPQVHQLQDSEADSLESLQSDLRELVEATLENIEFVK